MKNIFIVGNNVDKKLVEKVRNVISRDKDIRRLISRGTTMIFLKFFLVLTAFGFSVYGLLGTEFRISFTIPGLIIAVFSFVSFCKDCMEMKEKSMSIIGYMKYIFSKSRPGTPHDIWRYIPGSVADIQMVNTCKHVNDAEIGVMYAGMPYYDTIFIDRIYVRWHTEGKKMKWLHRLRQKISYYRFLDDFSQRTIIAMADKRYFKKENKHIEYSNSVFGILFSSMYIESEVRRLDLTYSKENKIKIVICIKDKAERRYAEEWIRYCTNPDTFEIVPEGQPCTLEITGISVLRNQKSAKPGKSIAIPVKRFIALPVCKSSQDKSPFPDVTKTEEGCNIICIGGAEQNLALQACINSYRWQNKSDRTGCEIGFAENVLDNVSDSGFLAGTEGLVYGVRGSVIGRMISSQTSSCRSEVYRLCWSKPALKGVNMYGIYGYSAMATKMTLCHIVRNITDSSTDNLVPQSDCCIPGRRMKPQELLDFVVTDETDKPIFATDDGQLWDCEDLMNNYKALIGVLDDKNTNHIRVVEE